MFEILTHKQQEEEIEKNCKEEASFVSIFPPTSFWIIRIYAVLMDFCFKI